MRNTKIKRLQKYYQHLLRFVMLMSMTALLCITSPGFAQISKMPETTSIAQTQSGLSLEQQARRLYQEGKFSEAAKLFEQAAQAYKASSDPIRQGLSLSNLSLCYQQLGQWNQASSVITNSLEILNTNKSKNLEGLLALAQALDIQGGLQLARGQADAALKSWEGATVIYTQQNQSLRLLANQTNQAQALQNLGLYGRSVSLLASALKLPADSITDAKKLKTSLEGVSASPETTIALRNLGDALRVVGTFTPAQLVLERSLTIANQLQLPDIVALAQLSLGSVSRAQADAKTALNFYQKAAAPSANNHIRIQAQLNQLNLLVDTQQQDAAKILLPQLKQQVEALPPSQMAIEARVNLAYTMMQMAEKSADETFLGDIAQLLTVAVQQAKELGNPRLQADALGSLGSVYERSQKWVESEKLTQQAVQLAQQINAGDIAYRWQWQLGRVTKAQGKIETAIAAYQEAINNIKSLRADLAAASPDVQFSFRNAVEPIHRELVGLLVESSQKDNLKTARDVIEGLQLVELDNFFREACLTAKPELIDQVDQKAAVIYPIILEDQLAIIASLPKSPQAKANKPKEADTRDFRYYKTAIKKDEVERLALKLRNNLNQSNASDFVLPLFQQMYDLVIAPEAADLAASKVETLVFVLDGVLRNIPMAALYDEQQKKFLVEKYSIVLTPGLQLLAPRSLRQERLGALVAGVSEARPGFSALPNVKNEVQKIESDVPTQVLLNEKFTNSAFQDRVSVVSYPIVHLATHGQFGPTADETFILTWDGTIKVNQLSSLIKTVELSRNNSLELLILSACETASGDAKSALGLAGIAVRSGARSTVATLWRVNDEASTALISQFYDQLIQASKTGVSKAEALRRAQISILQNSEYKSPYYWAAYVLLGNWI
ncbi:CHAT domain-containing protein [Nostoc sp. NMS8]|uniref:CHAT domain-containing protein n=1 Tax=Nostoc sp. NMS8 TaxID=2815392 RepID=UPI0025F806D9|nr:CHAT domain-containing protein [Nostoc sp. NMS8]MBN3958719.1 CHAT domain-containing protein [Nostoc sp. NMS8]